MSMFQVEGFSRGPGAGSAVGGGAPIILLSDNADVVSRIVALEVGADDLLSTPVDSRLLLAQTRALLRRSKTLRDQRSEALAANAGWALDPVAREAIGPDGARLGHHAMTPAD